MVSKWRMLYRLFRDCVGMALLSVLAVTHLVGCSGEVDSVPNGSAEEVATLLESASETVEAGEPAEIHPADAAAADGNAPPHQHQNRLAQETSPYLLLHAHNPVDWYPWGQEALDKAKRENKLIFLSVGYSSCYWCHVMERESFTDAEISQLLNEHFVCIKVDREERPDVDNIYMTAVQLISGRGGWPMSMFLTPDAKPFFGGTYFPAHDNDRPGATGFLTIVRKMQQVWQDESQQVHQYADKLTVALKAHLERNNVPDQVELDQSLFDRVFQELASEADVEFGGFGYSATRPDQPKFPEPPKLMFLIEMSRRSDQAATRQLLENTLDRMAEGGIRDHWGGGFHRYSTDRQWLIPHFEKMLYDNGQLATVYAEAFELTNRPVYRQVVEELLAFVAREMTATSGAYYAALDAETDGHEGRFYAWKLDEIQPVLEDSEWNLLAPVYGLDGPPNFEQRYHVPRLVKRLSDLSEDGYRRREAMLETIRKKLLAARNQRERPLTDVKIITSWNGLMIRGFADAGRILQNDSYLDSARVAADFVLANLMTPGGRLLRCYTSGRAELAAYLDDYAFFVDGLIAIHRATEDPKWLDLAQQLTETQLELFWDDQHRGFYFTADDHQSLIARAKDPVDGVRPAGISVAASNLVYLAGALDDPKYLDRANATIQSSADLLKQSPTSLTRLVTAAMAAEEWKVKSEE